MQLLQGNHMFCDIHIFSATTTTTAEALRFSIQELPIVECSGRMQVKFCVVFFVQRKFCVTSSCKNKILHVFLWCNVCNNFFFWSSVSATKISMKVLRIEMKQSCTFQSNRNQTELFRDRQSTAKCMCVFACVSRTR